MQDSELRNAGKWALRTVLGGTPWLLPGYNSVSVWEQKIKRVNQMVPLNPPIMNKLFLYFQQHCSYNLYYNWHIYAIHFSKGRILPLEIYISCALLSSNFLLLYPHVCFYLFYFILSMRRNTNSVKLPFFKTTAVRSAILVSNLLPLWSYWTVWFWFLQAFSLPFIRNEWICSEQRRRGICEAMWRENKHR